MNKRCEDIAEILVDYADGELSAEQSSMVAEHLAGCDDCRRLVEGLRRSLELAETIWEDNLEPTETIRIAAPTRTSRRSWRRYAAAAAAVLVVSAISIVWCITRSPSTRQPTFAEIERKITEAGNAARLLAAADLLNGYSEAGNIAQRQYRYIVETYPDTSAASKAKSRAERF